MTTLPEASDGSELAGFENWRTEVRGSAAVRALGATIFPQLAVQDLHIMPGRHPPAKKVRGGVSIE